MKRTTTTAKTQPKAKTKTKLKPEKESMLDAVIRLANAAEAIAEHLKRLTPICTVTVEQAPDTLNDGDKERNREITFQLPAYPPPAPRPIPCETPHYRYELPGFAYRRNPDGTPMITCLSRVAE